MTAKIMDRAERRRVIARSGSASRDESPFWWREVAQENSFGPTRYPGRPEHVGSVDANFHCGSVESLLAVVVIVAVGRDS